ncbi:glycogenin-1 isoform X1 [Drosophila grimshawi]|uniref:glycogenin-1 isoform X1 n=1 Tax=Drosophila grimshawi TaxID=7222 RepID=UPI001C933BEF|nr:glycogenin-1 isoform X1 [Drosophila grimshawi]
MVTPTVSEAMRDRLKEVYNVVQEVNVMDSHDAANLALLARPELGVTFTKLHCWRLVQFEKCVFLDADTLVLKNCDELFEREELSAAPDVSWPDCFNSGVFVYTPSVDTFNKITEFAVQHGSFDGGDQGLLNQYFADWATADIKKHLPFIYNVTAYASYCYLPAFKQFRDKIKILHFAGKLKPWLIHFNTATKTADTPTDYAHAQDLIQHWWTIFCDSVHESLSDNMYLCLNITHSPSNTDSNYDADSYYNRQQEQQRQQYVPHVREYRDPWADYYEQVERHQNQPEPEPEPQPESVSESVYESPNENAIENSCETQVLDAQRRRWSHSEACRPTSSLQPQEQQEQPPPAHKPTTANEEPKAIDVNSNTCETEQSPTHQEHQPEQQHHHQNHHHHQHHEHHPVHSTIEQNATQATLSHQPQIEDVAVAAEAGLAGALSQLRIGVERTPEQEQYENLMRRQCWESGQVDYSGADAFDNIWKKITKTLEAKPEKPTEADQTGSS